MLNALLYLPPLHGILSAANHCCFAETSFGSGFLAQEINTRLFILSCTRINLGVDFNRSNAVIAIFNVV